MKRVAIITSSDTGYRGEREDLSGPAIREIVEKNGYEVVSEDVLPDFCLSFLSYNSPEDKL